MAESCWEDGYDQGLGSRLDGAEEGDCLWEALKEGDPFTEASRGTAWSRLEQDKAPPGDTVLGILWDQMGAPKPRGDLLSHCGSRGSCGEGGVLAAKAGTDPPGPPWCQQ